MNATFDLTKHPDYREPRTDAEKAKGLRDRTYGGLPGVPMDHLDEATWQQLSPTQQRSVIASPMYRVPKDWRQGFQTGEAERQKDAEQRGQVVASPVVIEADAPRKRTADTPAEKAASEVPNG
jgi:hypothetical protein